MLCVVLFSERAQAAIGAVKPAAAGTAAACALSRLRGLTYLINQAVGDALSDMLMVEVSHGLQLQSLWIIPTAAVS